MNSRFHGNDEKNLNIKFQVSAICILYILTPDT